ncbi:MAG TPA: hypothetical protein VMQ11_12665 [Alphaproteobacteria bacterium]|nr:hypothetical protein [Alphaproteobacteria bacterium]
MDRRMLIEHLAKANKHVEAGERRVLRQRELVAELERDGHDTAAARQLLVQFEKLQEMHKADRDRLERDLVAG